MDKKTEDVVDASKRAVRHVLNQIKTNDKVRYHLGAGTQSFTLLCTAAHHLFDQPVDEIANHFIPGSGEMTKRFAELEVAK